MTDKPFSQICQKEGCRKNAIIHVTHELEDVESYWDVCGEHVTELSATLTALMVRYSTYAPGGSDGNSM
jgi:hypothetical protein